MSRRSQITMTAGEVADYIDSQHTMILSTLKPDGRPHVVPLWFARDGEDIWAWSFAKAQKVRNLRRSPQATVLFESGRSYPELRGVSLECDVELVEDPAGVERLGFAVAARYSGVDDRVEVAGEGRDGQAADGLRAFVRGQVAKRVGMLFRPTRVMSWDHGKLGGVY